MVYGSGLTRKRSTHHPEKNSGPAPDTKRTNTASMKSSHRYTQMHADQKGTKNEAEKEGGRRRQETEVRIQEHGATKSGLVGTGKLK